MKYSQVFAACLAGATLVSAAPVVLPNTRSSGLARRNNTFKDYAKPRSLGEDEELTARLTQSYRGPNASPNSPNYSPSAVNEGTGGVKGLQSPDSAREIGLSSRHNAPKDLKIRSFDEDGELVARSPRRRKSKHRRLHGYRRNHDHDNDNNHRRRRRRRHRHRDDEREDRRGDKDGHQGRERRHRKRNRGGKRKGPKHDDGDGGHRQGKGGSKQGGPEQGDQGQNPVVPSGPLSGQNPDQSLNPLGGPPSAGPSSDLLGAQGVQGPTTSSSPDPLGAQGPTSIPSQDPPAGQDPSASSSPPGPGAGADAGGMEAPSGPPPGGAIDSALGDGLSRRGLEPALVSPRNLEIDHLD